MPLFSVFVLSGSDYIAVLKLMCGFWGEASQYRNSRSTAEVIAGMLSPLHFFRALNLFKKRYSSDN